ncbi:hypothetical protein LEP1GSC058_2801 [Leptospira fainei serovar Hurstbridge str. BUT 6]|uniref:Uncharacterized protein n=1 Tax=Leptospira fainei serovar Hurstbridge str. BUT 6 TaxID=1193011 RepID=S3UXL1_9LEPT|nr:hypothetical protein LEP1GSC058_2801 [Leptospira fainei serovar Hurstbridge str. BUT 6]
MPIRSEHREFFRSFRALYFFWSRLSALYAFLEKKKSLFPLLGGGYFIFLIELFSIPVLTD